MQVLASDYEAQKAMGPFLENPVLRRIIQTFTNDADGDFGKWANNPQVLAMLTQAKRLMDDGHMTPAEMENHLLQHLQVHTTIIPLRAYFSCFAGAPGKLTCRLLNRILPMRRALTSRPKQRNMFTCLLSSWWPHSTNTYVI